MPNHPTTILTAEHVAARLPSYDGVPITLIYDEVTETETYMVIGHVDPGRFLAAMHAHAHRDTDLAPEDLHLDTFTTEDGESAPGWHIVYGHADRNTVQAPDYYAEDWCVCDDYTWWSTKATGPGDGAIPTMTWRVN